MNAVVLYYNPNPKQKKIIISANQKLHRKASKNTHTQRPTNHYRILKKIHHLPPEHPQRVYETKTPYQTVPKLPYKIKSSLSDFLGMLFSNLLNFVSETIASCL